MATCAYTIVEYFPKTFNDESINVGFAFHNATNGEIKFLKAKNKKRITSFDDELDIKTYNEMINSIENFITMPFKKTLFNEPDDKICKNINYLNNIKNNFLNEFRFSNIFVIESENPNEDFEKYCKIYLYFDYDKCERPKMEDISRTLKKEIKIQLKNNNLEYKEKFDTTNISEFGEGLPLDFKVGNNYIKILDIRSDNFNKLNTAKIWAYNIQYFTGNNNLFFAIPTKPETKEEIAYYQILKKANAKIYQMNELNQMLNDID